ncbi:hypothetical protein MFLO_14397 [Listeria floridensis FSL S10-1187]|uniref:Uncharacterized protein n=1 Tax=Listeria floridensis FSL S10-1187 TaxID=1265817 RepID=A0ABP3AWQ3_9LIST|nr:hypothetical protein MFLO_14397 [Listeria floridensis FSL S10-1187]
MATETEVSKPSLEEQKGQLTNKNLQYVQEVEKHLKTTDYGEAQRTEIVREMIEKNSWTAKARCNCT